MNKREQDKLWEDAEEYIGDIPRYRFHDEWYYVVSDSAFVVTDEITLHGALSLFNELATGTAAIYLYRGHDHLATYNGLQSDPNRETTYHVTKDALPEWLAAFKLMR